MTTGLRALRSAGRRIVTGPDAIPVFLLWLVALLAHAVVFATAAICVWPDTGRYLDYGRALLTGDPTRLPPNEVVQVVPLYPLLAATAGLLLPAPAVALALTQHLLLSLVPVLVYLLLRERSPGLAVVGGVWCALDPALLLFCQSLLTEPLYALLLVVVVWAVDAVLRTAHVSWAAGAGLALGLLFATRPIALALFVPVLLVLAVYRVPARSTLACGAALAVCFLGVTLARDAAASASRRGAEAGLVDLGRRLFNMSAGLGLISPDNGPASQAVSDLEWAYGEGEDRKALVSRAGVGSATDRLLLAASGEALVRNPLRFLRARAPVLWKLLWAPEAPQEVFLPLGDPAFPELDAARSNRKYLLAGAPYLTLLGPDVERQTTAGASRRVRLALMRVLDIIAPPHLLLCLFAAVYGICCPRDARRDRLYWVLATVLAYHLCCAASLASPLARYRDVLNPLFICLGLVSLYGLAVGRPGTALRAWVARSGIGSDPFAVVRAHARGARRLGLALGLATLCLVGWRLAGITPGPATRAEALRIPVGAEWESWVRLREVRLVGPLTNYDYNTVTLLWEVRANPDARTREDGVFRFRVWRGEQMGQALVVDDPRSQTRVSDLAALSAAAQAPAVVEMHTTFLLYDREERPTTAQTLAVGLLYVRDGRIVDQSVPTLPAGGSPNVQRAGAWVHIRVP